VFIVAASSLARAGLQSLFGTRDVEVTGSAPNFESLAGQWPTVKLTSFSLTQAGEQLEGVLESLAASQIASEAGIVVLSDHTEPRLLAEALRAGVRAVLPSDISTRRTRRRLKAASAD